MHHPFLFIIFCVLVTACTQTTPGDRTLLNHADNLMETHPDSSLLLIKKISTPKKLSSSDKALYSLLYSQALDKCDQYLESDSLIKPAITYYPSGNEAKRAGYAFFYLSRCERNRGNAQGRAEALIKAMPFANKCKDYKLLGFIYGEKASIYKEQKQTDSMLYYNELSLYAIQKAGDKRNAVISLLNIGYGNYLLKKFDIALYYLKIAEHEANPLNEPLLSSSIYRIIGLTYFFKKNYPKALYYTRLSAITSDTYDYDKWTNLAQIFIKTGELDSARYYLNKCLLSGNKPPICYQSFQKLAEKQGRFAEALSYAKLAAEAQDSVNKRTLATSFAGMEKKYNYERVNVENKQLVIKNQQYAIAAILALLFCLIVIILILIERNRQKKLELRHVASQNLIREQQLELQIGQVNKIALLQKMIQLRLIPGSNLSQIGAQYLKLFGEEQELVPTNIEEVMQSIELAYPDFLKLLLNRYPSLTPREIQICCCLKAGFEQSVILAILEIKSETYYRHRSKIRQKFGVNFEDKIDQILSAL